MIDRKKLISSHNPIMQSIEYDSPLSVGNGELAFTADVTGMQSLYHSYLEQNMPLCIMSQWGWHTTPVNKEKSTYSENELELTEYQYENHKVFYPVERKEGNEEVYDWLRHNPHRANLATIGLKWKNADILPTDLSDIHQQLHLYEGRIESDFLLNDKPCKVATICDSEEDTLGFEIKSEAFCTGELKVKLAFPYGAFDISGSDWHNAENHKTIILSQDKHMIRFQRIMDNETYYISLKSENEFVFKQLDVHEFEIHGLKDELVFTVHFTRESTEKFNFYNQSLQNSRLKWEQFWNKGGIVDFKNSKDSRAKELERRVILSQYLSAIQCCGSIPPQETGLTCNSWYGKFHLEMHFWHCGYLPLWNHSELLEKSLPWYKEHLKTAKRNAQKNNYQGARWPKMVAYDGVDSPSHIAPLLIWQQSHIIYMLELMYNENQNNQFLEEYWEIVSETTDFMCDFLSFNKEKNQYDLVAPLIPAQEEFDPKDVKNPTFELEYWKFTIGISIKWAERLEKDCKIWNSVFEKIALPPENNGLYLAHQNCLTTFTEFNKDHPSMLGAFGLIPSDRISPDKIKTTLETVLKCWDFETMWGWDFAMMAMTAVRLGFPELAMDILLMDSPKNQYVTSGNNYQRLRTDLPLYLPGNGSLLLAISLMVAGYRNCNTPLPGIPKNGMWEVEFENISKLP